MTTEGKDIETNNEPLFRVTFVYSNKKKIRLLKKDSKWENIEKMINKMYKLDDIKWHCQYNNDIWIEDSEDWISYLDGHQRKFNPSSLWIHIINDSHNNNINNDNSNNIKVIYHHYNSNLVTKQGIICWFDSQRKDHLNDKRWKSLVNEYTLKPMETTSYVDRTYRATIHKSDNIIFKKSPNLNGITGVYCDYAHTLGFNNPINNVQTIVSVHNFMNSFSYEMNGCGGKICNFYVLTSYKNYALHGGYTTCFKKNFKHCAPNVRPKILLDMDDNEISGDMCKHWDQHRISILSTNGNMSKANIDRIGADRTCHHYCGIIIELILYDRVLSKQEKKRLQIYLNNKYFNKNNIVSKGF